MELGSQWLFPEFNIESGEFANTYKELTLKSLEFTNSKERARLLTCINLLEREALKLFLPDTVNNMLYAMSQSQELFCTFLQPLKYYLNICYMECLLEAKVKPGPEKSLKIEYCLFVAQVLCEFAPDELMSIFEADIKPKNYDMAQNIASLYIQISKGTDLKIEFTYGETIKATTIPYKFENAQVFRYNSERISENLRILERDLSDAEKNIYREFMKQDIDFCKLGDDIDYKHDSADEDLLQTANSILDSCEIPHGEFRPILKLLALRVLGEDFVRVGEYVYSLATPQQLTILLASSADKEFEFERPAGYIPLMIDKHLYYELQYAISSSYEAVSMLSEYHTRLMSDFLKHLDTISRNYYNSVPHRTLFFHSLSTNSIFVQISKDENEACQFIIPAVPTGSIELEDLPPQIEFIHSNLRLDYVFEFVLIEVISAGLLLCEPLASEIEHVITLGQLLGEDASVYQDMLELTSKITTLIKMVTRSAETPELLYFCVTKSNMMNEEILAIITILKCGFLSLRHSTMQKILSFELNHYEFVRYDRETVWETFLEHMQIYAKHDLVNRGVISPTAPTTLSVKEPLLSPDNANDTLDSARCLLSMSVNNASIVGMSMRAYLCERIPLLEAFLELDEIPFFGNTERPVTFLGQSSTSPLIGKLSPEHAKTRLIAIIHELQHIPRHSYLSDLDLEIPLLPEILADATSITPLSAAIRFHYKDEAGVDAGGMWRATLTLVFDDLLAEKPITNEVLYSVKAANKFGERDLQFEILNEDNPNQPSLLKVINLNNKSILVPHYNGYNCETSSSIFPRLTDKRSCLYYLGRIFSFCLVYSGRVPDFLHYNFWKSLVGGRLYFDEALIQEHSREYNNDPMFKINGTKRFNELLYPLSSEQIKLYYRQYYDIWQTAMRGEVTDIDMLGIHPKIVEELQRQQVNLNIEGNVQRYAKLALKQLSTGQSLGKAYSEFRNGFRHPFATTMVNPVGLELELLAREIDFCFDVITWRDLHDLMTFDPDEEELINREEIVSNLLERNIASIELEHELTDHKMLILTRIKELLSDKTNYSHKEMLDFVFAVTGQRSLRGTEITINFTKPSKEVKGADGKFERKFILFHTCFNEMDIPLGYSCELTEEEFALYFRECVQYALQNGFALT